MGIFESQVDEKPFILVPPVCPQNFVNRIAQERCELQTSNLVCRSAVGRTTHTKLLVTICQSVSLYVYLKTNSLFAISYERLDLKFGRWITYPLKWSHRKFGRNEWIFLPVRSPMNHFLDWRYPKNGSI